MTSKITTKVKILNAAEALFANSGFAETSMREITAKAGVNLASVNYHFGSKKDLIKAVVDRYLERFVPLLLEKIETLEKCNKNYSVSELFECFKSPLLALNSINKDGSVFFLKLIGRGYVDFQGHLRRFITEKYGESLQVIQQCFHKTMPQLTPSEVFWRLHFTIGTSVFTLAASEALIDISRSDFDLEMTPEKIVDQLLPYLAAGFAS
ncbi:MAG: TetR/AcrR family transcriptional regulator [Gammaproteobacteria bacterium]|nr:TetR/AcrR family transcriptional regulator [Gammaproteobacteria bacterium]